MRNSFAQQIKLLADEDPTVRLLVGDIGFRIFDDFLSKHPSYFINCGIAEQNMIGCAAGMASEGLKVFVYTITPFLTMRAFEQIRVDVGINCSNIVLVGVGAGLAYDKLGPTHHAYEDLAIMQSIPNLKVYTPYDGPSTSKAIIKSYNQLEKEASYVRLSKGGEPTINMLSINSNIDKWSNSLSPDFVIITHGSIAGRFTVKQLGSGLNYDVLAIKELSKDTSDSLVEIMDEYRESCTNFIFCEESFLLGSFYSTFISENFSLLKDFNIKHLCLPKEYIYEVMERDMILKNLGFTPQGILSKLNR